MTDKPRVLLTDKTAFQLAKKYIDAGDVDGFNKMFMPMTPQMLVLTEQSIKADERQKVLAEVESWLVDEDIDIVHHFYSCRVSSEHRCPQCKKTGCEAYVYSGGMVNGRNSLRAELRAKLAEMKGGENETT